MHSVDTRPAAVAGRFYPAQAEALRAEVRAYLRAAQAIDPPLALALPKMLLVPHAGYVYSGPVAAGAYARLAEARGRIRRVVLLGPTHRVPVRGLAIPSVEAFATPLGRVMLDRAALDGLAELPQVVVSDAAHAHEHALEVQLPFLQHLLGDFSLVPLAVGRADPADVARVIEHLWGGDETLVVISSDLSHYLPYDAARARDSATIARVLDLNPVLGPDDACGATPLAGALIAARNHGLLPRLVDLRNSGDTEGDRVRVVGYAAVVFEAPPPGSGRPATDEHGEALLGDTLIANARHAIAERLGVAAGTVAPTLPGADAPVATFVTLRRQGELRGCIGTLQAHRPLLDDVRAHAVAAAFDDPRFAPLAAHEFDDLEIEVSLLDAAEPLDVATEDEARRALRPGIDGVVLEWRHARATFLPQVWEQLAEPAEFLRALRRKAGLAADFWAEDLRLARYSVRKFTQAGA